MVTSYTQLLAREYQDKLDPRASLYIRHAVEGAQRMETLLHDLREYWSVDEQKVEELVVVDCNEVLRRALDYLQAALRESGATVTHEPLPPVLAEVYPITLLFQNLIGNAIKYRRADAPPKVLLSAEPDGNLWRFSVTDNGIGIDAQFVEMIFAPFKRLHSKKYPGTGIGLAMCRKIVERYHGRIWVTSKPGEGSTFLFTLPGSNGRN